MLRRVTWENEDLPKLEVEFEAIKAEYERSAKAIRDGEGDRDAAAKIKSKLFGETLFKCSPDGAAVHPS